jgi:hypothetical protein
VSPQAGEQDVVGNRDHACRRREGDAMLEPTGSTEGENGAKTNCATAQKARVGLAAPFCTMLRHRDRMAACEFHRRKCARANTEARWAVTKMV